MRSVLAVVDQIRGLSFNQYEPVGRATAAIVTDAATSVASAGVTLLRLDPPEEIADQHTKFTLDLIEWGRDLEELASCEVLCAVKAGTISFDSTTLMGRMTALLQSAAAGMDGGTPTTR